MICDNHGSRGLDSIFIDSDQTEIDSEVPTTTSSPYPSTEGPCQRRAPLQRQRISQRCIGPEISGADSNRNPGTSRPRDDHGRTRRSPQIPRRDTGRREEIVRIDVSTRRQHCEVRLAWMEQWFESQRNRDFLCNVGPLGSGPNVMERNPNVFVS